MRVIAQTAAIVTADPDESRSDPLVCLPRTHYSGFDVPRPRKDSDEDPPLTRDRPLPVASQSLVELSWQFFTSQPLGRPDIVRATQKRPLPIEAQSVPIPMHLFLEKDSEWHRTPVILLPVHIPSKSQPRSLCADEVNGDVIATYITWPSENGEHVQEMIEEALSTPNTLDSEPVDGEVQRHATNVFGRVGQLEMDDAFSRIHSGLQRLLQVLDRLAEETLGAQIHAMPQLAQTTPNGHTDSGDACQPIPKALRRLEH